MENIRDFTPTGKVETITPVMAEEYLRHNDHNPRKSVIRRRVECYARDMAAGQWFLNCEPIVFDANGDLKNGQHRLLAIIKANVPVKMYVVRDINPMITTFDYGGARQPNQEIGCSKGAVTLSYIITTNAYYLGTPAKGVAIDYVRRHQEEINRAIALSAVGTKRAIGNKRDVYTAIYLMRRCGENDKEIEQFMRVVNTQFMLTERESSSAIVLFKYLNERRSITTTRSEILTGIATVLAAFADFSRGAKRTMRYSNVNTALAQNMLTAVRREDGLEDGDRAGD